MDTKHEALLQHFIHRRLQELASPHHFASTLPGFMSPSILPHLYSSVFVGGGGNVEETATDLSCPRRHQSSDESLSTRPANTAASTAISSAEGVRRKSNRKESKSTTRKQDQQHAQQVSAKSTEITDQSVHVNHGVPAPQHTMMSAPPMAAAPSPFRSPGGGSGGMLRTSPWPPAAHAPEGFGRFAVGGSVFSLFPSVPNATEASAIYSQASNSPGGRFGGQTSAATTFHSFLGAQKGGDTLFSAGFPLTPNSIPSSSPQQQQHQLFGSPGLSPATAHLQAPLEAERGLSQLELMARGLQQPQRQDHQEPERCKQPSVERRPRTKERRQSKKWAVLDKKNDGISVKPETTRTSCGCAGVRTNASVVSSSSTGLMVTNSCTTTACHTPLLRNGEMLTAFHSPMTTSPASPTNQRMHESAENRLHHQQSGGCSRTTPLPPRSRSNETCAAFTPVAIKKEAGSSTPCQVAEVTTSRGTAAAALVVAVTPSSPLAANQGTKVAVSSAPTSPTRTLPLTTIKTEPISEPVECMRKDALVFSQPIEATSHSQMAPNNVAGIPVGIAVARQRTEQSSTSVLTPASAPNDVVAKSSRCTGAGAPPVIAPALEKQQQASRDDFRVLLPTRGRPGQHNHHHHHHQQQTVVSTCVLTSVPAPVSVQATGTLAVHHEEQRTTTLTIPASSIVLQSSPSTAAANGAAVATAPGTTLQPSSAATLQVQTPGGTLTSCDEATAVALAARLTNGIPSWTNHTTHNSALTPPTLWLGQPQYPTGPAVPLQLEAPPSLPPPLPPVGLQLVRDPVSGHYLLVPAASLEQLQRAAAAVQVWPNSSGGFTSATSAAPQHIPQLMLNQSTPQLAPAPQHITLFPSQPVPTSAAPVGPETEFRILLPPQHAGPQLALLHEAVKAKKPGEMEPPKLELLDTMAKLLPAESAQAATSSTYPTTSFVFPAPQTAVPPPNPQAPPPTAQLQYFYEQLTAGGMQVTPHTPITATVPAPSIPDSGRRSQGTSPANPAEGCLTPPPEASSPAEASCAERVVAAPVATECLEAAAADSSCAEPSTSEEPTPSTMTTEVTVQDASNQTETPPVSEDEANPDEDVSPMEPTTPPPPPPVDVSGLELLSNSIEQFTQREAEQQQQNEVTARPPTPPPAAAPPVTEHLVGGLGLLCALAEQRFMEDIVSHKEEPAKQQPTVAADVRTISNKSSNSTSTTDRIDINRNYKSPKSEQEIKKFIAAKVSQYQEQTPSSSDVHSTDFMDAMELDMRMRLAELQRRYKEKQKELSKLQNPRRTSDDGSNSPGKRGPGRPRKRKLSSPQSPSRSSSSRPARAKKERSPPVLEKEDDAIVTPIKVQKATKDILKPPTLTKILAASRLKPCKFKLPTPSNGLKSPSNKPLRPSKQDNVDSSASSPVDPDVAGTTACTGATSSWLTGGGGFSSFRRTTGASSSSSAARKLSPLTATARPQQPLSGYTFGSKQLTPSLLSGGEKQRLESLASDSLFWFVKPDREDSIKGSGDAPPAPTTTTTTTTTTTNMTQHQFGALPGQKCKSTSEAESDHETAPSLFALAAASSSSSCSSCSSSSSSSSSKKRKPGRPKRRAPSRQDETATETIVAKKPKSISFLLSPPIVPPTFSTTTASVLYKPKIRPKLKAEAKVKSSLDDEEDSWPQQQRSVPRPDTTVAVPEIKQLPEIWTSENDTPSERLTNGVDAATRLGTKKKSLTARKRCPADGGSKPRASSTESNKKTREVSRPLKKKTSSPSAEQTEADAVEATVNGTPSCLLTLADLEGEPRALAVMGGLVYAGHVTAIRAPDVYGITLDGERGNRPHIFPREEMLKEAIREVKPKSTSEVPPGTRICAYWSQQYRCLYPGTVAAPSTPDPNLDQSFVNVEFDDGDSGRIHLDDIRLLPRDFPIVEYDPNPLLSLAKRRRRASGASSTEGRRTSSEVPLNIAEDLPAVRTPSPAPPSQSPAPSSKPADTESKDRQLVEPDSMVAVVPKLSEEEERERRRQRKRERARKKEKLRKLLARGVAALGKLPGRKKHKKHRCEDRHHHRHHHRRRKHRHHRHDKCRSSAENSSTPASSSPAPEPQLPPPVPEPPKVVEPPKPEPPPPKAAPTVEVANKKTKVSSGTPVRRSAEQSAEKSCPGTTQTETKSAAAAKKRQERQSSGESRSKMAAFLPARQLWRWAGRGYKRPGAKGRGKKEFFKSIQRGKETINVGDCAVFLSTGRPDRPYIGRIETMWESWGGNMVVRVKWFYHPEETQGGEGIDRLKYPGALFQSPHADENDVQTISHRCEVLALSEYTRRLGKEPSRYSAIYDNNDIYYLAGHYDPTAGVLTMEPGVTDPVTA